MRKFIQKYADYLGRIPRRRLSEFILIWHLWWWEL